MARTPKLSFSHIGFHIIDIDKMERFYTGYLGFTVTDRGELDTPMGRQKLVFMSRDPRDHHQIVLATGRPTDLNFNPINQLSFRLEDFAGLREMWRRLEGQPVSDINPVSHGNALSVYFRDPEGNRIELFYDTPWYVDQPMRIPMDMNLDDAALLRWAEQVASTLPGFRPAEQWRAEIAQKMNA